jgi:hypothetical protein
MRYVVLAAGIYTRFMLHLLFNGFNPLPSKRGGREREGGAQSKLSHTTQSNVPPTWWCKIFGSLSLLVPVPFSAKFYNLHVNLYMSYTVTNLRYKKQVGSMNNIYNLYSWLDGILSGIQKILVLVNAINSILYYATAISFHILSNSSFLPPLLHSPRYRQCCYVRWSTNKWIN